MVPILVEAEVAETGSKLRNQQIGNFHPAWCHQGNGDREYCVVQGHDLSDAEEYSMSMEEYVDINFAKREGGGLQPAAGSKTLKQM